MMDTKAADKSPRVPVRTRRLIVRSLLVLALVGLGAVSLVVGKGHTVVLDNMRPKAESDPPAPRLVTIRLDGKEPVELTAGVRDLALLMGQSHTYEVDWLNGQPPQRGEFSIPFSQEYVLVSIPRLKAGRDDWIEPFFPFEQAAVTNDPDSARTIQRSDAAIPAP
jgi:hypothetical protein